MSGFKIENDVVIAMLETLFQHRQNGLNKLQERYDAVYLADYLGYMRNTGFVQADFTLLADGESYIFDNCELLAKGFAHIGQDEGIYHKANTLTIDLDEAMIRQLLIGSIHQNAEASKQQQLIDSVKSLPKEVLIELIKDFVVKGITGSSILKGLMTAISQ